MVSPMKTNDAIMRACAACGSGGPTIGNLNRCARCKGFAYCSKECQSLDWTYHKRFCGKIQMKTDPTKGRVLVACKYFAPGDIVCEEPVFSFCPFVSKGTIIDPSALKCQQALCLGCCRPIFSPYQGGVNTHEFTCACGCRFCSESCAHLKGGQHMVECEILKHKTSGNKGKSMADLLNSILSKGGSGMASEDGSEVQLVFCIRLLLLKTKAPHLWNRVASLMVHDHDSPNKLVDTFGAGILDAFERLGQTAANTSGKALPVISMADLRHVAAVNSANGWEASIDFQYDAYNQYGFPVAKWPLQPDSVHKSLQVVGFMSSMIEHSCQPNCYPSVWYHPKSGPIFIARACSAIQAGDHLKISYMNARCLLEPYYSRIHRMQISKRFDCSCVRCLDVSDGGAYIGSPLCVECGDYMIPPVGEPEIGIWKCKICKKAELAGKFNAMVFQQAEATMEPIDSNTSMSERLKAAEKLESFLSEYKARLHEYHYVAININSDIETMLGLGTQPLTVLQGEYLYRAALKVAAMYERVFGSTFHYKDQGQVYFHAARGAVARWVEKEPGPWKTHFEESAKLLDLAHRSFLFTVGPDHVFTEASEGFAINLREIGSLGPKKMMGFGSHPYHYFNIFLGQEMMEYMNAT